MHHDRFGRTDLLIPHDFEDLDAFAISGPCGSTHSRDLQDVLPYPHVDGAVTHDGRGFQWSNTQANCSWPGLIRVGNIETNGSCSKAAPLDGNTIIEDSGIPYQVTHWSRASGLGPSRAPQTKTVIHDEGLSAVDDRISAPTDLDTQDHPNDSKPEMAIQAEVLSLAILKSGLWKNIKRQKLNDTDINSILRGCPLRPLDPAHADVKQAHSNETDEMLDMNDKMTMNSGWTMRDGEMPKVLKAPPQMWRERRQSKSRKSGWKCKECPKIKNSASELKYSSSLQSSIRHSGGTPG